MPTRRFFLRRENDRWIFGRDNLPYASYATKESAMTLADRFLNQYPGAELVVEDDAPDNLAARG